MSDNKSLLDFLDELFRDPPPPPPLGPSNSMMGGLGLLPPFGSIAPPPRSISEILRSAAPRTYTPEERRDVTWRQTAPYPSAQEFYCPRSGRLIRKADYGRKSSCGWDVGHIVADAFGGPDEPSNWQAQHWEFNQREGGLISLILRSLGEKP